MKIQHTATQRISLSEIDKVFPPPKAWSGRDAVHFIVNVSSSDVEIVIRYNWSTNEE